MLKGLPWKQTEIIPSFLRLFYVSCTYINQFVSLMNCSLYRYALSLSLVNSFWLKPISSAGTGGAAIATLFWLTCAQCHLPSIHCEPVFLFRAGISLLEAAYIGRLFFTQPATLCLLIGKLNPACPGGSDSKESACNAGDPGSIPGGRSPGEGNGSPLQYSCLENLMGREAWQDMVHGSQRHSP